MPGVSSAEPEVPGQDQRCQEEVDSAPEAPPVTEPEPPVIELQPELAAEAEAPTSEPAEMAPSSPTPADPAPAMPEENRVGLGFAADKQLREAFLGDFPLSISWCEGNISIKSVEDSIFTLRVYNWHVLP